VEAEILEQDDLVLALIGDDLAGGVAQAVVGQEHLVAGEFRESRAARLEAELRRGAALRPSEVGARITFAPASIACLMVGRVRTMRSSSVIFPPSSGTLKSTRMKTRCPASDSSSSRRMPSRENMALRPSSP